MTGFILLFLLVFLHFLVVSWFFLGKKMFNISYSFSPFECGFSIGSYSRIYFSIQFFLIALIFLIFDVELSLFLPLPLISSFVSVMLGIFFLFILFLGLVLEWGLGGLSWVI